MPNGDAVNSSRFPSLARPAAAVLALLLAGGLAPAQAVDEDVYPQHEYVGPDDDDKWQELETRLPAFPDPGQFRALPSQLPDTRLEIQLDPDSIRVDEDGVIRYLLRIQSPGGAGNLFYEGLRCETGEYRTYAYATSGDSWQRMRGADWQGLNSGGTARYRRFLHQHYFCEPTEGSLSVDEIRKRVRYGAPRFYDDP
ncbi:hypothetical protein D6C00_03495 [Thiohalobacter thiocyanaticus]|uniref:CNP1-like uncharacterized domain-containing protein n=1 Tax=Thiohalobacter thiocyanaticus TaxID=585455 RepID=A0A426QH78_9GAMM|nr:hypothetical protein D6C00_03495 [Thiohalobacter thiocyanaticus]